MTRVGRPVAVGLPRAPSGISQETERKSRHENTAKVARRRHNEKAEAVVVGGAKVIDPHADYLIPAEQIDVEPDEVRYLGQLVAGIQDYKILRGAIAVLNLATSTGYAHFLADLAMLSRGNKLVLEVFVVDDGYLFDGEDDGDDDGESEG